MRQNSRNQRMKTTRSIFQGLDKLFESIQLVKYINELGTINHQSRGTSPKRYHPKQQFRKSEGHLHLWYIKSSQGL